MGYKIIVQRLKRIKVPKNQVPSTLLLAALPINLHPMEPSPNLKLDYCKFKASSTSICTLPLPPPPAKTNSTPDLTIYVNNVSPLKEMLVFNPTWWVAVSYRCFLQYPSLFSIFLFSGPASHYLSVVLFPPVPAYCAPSDLEIHSDSSLPMTYVDVPLRSGPIFSAGLVSDCHTHPLHEASPGSLWLPASIP